MTTAAHAKPYHDAYRGFEIDYSPSHDDYMVWRHGFMVFSASSYEACTGYVDHLLDRWGPK
jgi:hypothetical protein